MNDDGDDGDNKNDDADPLWLRLRLRLRRRWCWCWCWCCFGRDIFRTRALSLMRTNRVLSSIAAYANLAYNDSFFLFFSQVES